MKYKKFAILISLIFIFWNAGITLAFADIQSKSPISVADSVNKTTIHIGDLITYSVIIEHDKNVEVTLPSLGENLGGFEIRDYHEYEPRKKKDRVIHQVDYVISTFDVGEFDIPPISVGYKIPPDTVQQVAKTLGQKIIVESMKPSEDGDIREIKPPIAIPFNWKPVIVIGLISLAAILLIIAIIYIIRKRKKGEAIIPRRLEPPKPPHELAYEELQKLFDSDFLETGRLKLFYSELSDIIRRYIEGRYQIIAMEMTTTEVLDQLRNSSIEESHFDLFVRFLEACDLVKFAKYIPGDDENQQIMNLATQIVDETRWKEPEPVEPEEKTKLNDSSEISELETSPPVKNEDEGVTNFELNQDQKRVEEE